MTQNTVTDRVRPGGSFRVEKDPDTGQELLVQVEADTAPNENPGGNVDAAPAPAPDETESAAPSRAARGRR